MQLNVEIIGTGQDVPQVSTEQVEAGQLDPLMLVYDPADGEVDIVAVEPAAFQQDGPDGRPERWVRILLADVADPVDLPATSKQLIVYGADPATLQPMLDPDLLSTAQEALAFNGMCSEHDDEPPDLADDEEERPVYCGLPSDPKSHYRLCPRHDDARLDQSDRLSTRNFRPTYGRTAVL